MCVHSRYIARELAAFYLMKLSARMRYYLREKKVTQSAFFLKKKPWG
jgi:hypothetical protein